MGGNGRIGVQMVAKNRKRKGGGMSLSLRIKLLCPCRF